MTDAIIVIPCYNEAARVDLEAFQRFTALGHPQRFLFVDDGSTDSTFSVLQQFCQAEPTRFLLHRLPQNRGKAEAVRQGVLWALKQGCDMVGYWDADLATPLDAIPQFQAFLEANPRVQIAIGARVKLLGRQIQRRAMRHYLGRVFATAASLTLGLAVYDTQCGAKLFRVTPEIRQLFESPFRTNWIFDVELLARVVQSCRRSGQSAEEVVCEIPLQVWRDVRGSKVRASAFLGAAFDLGVIYWTYLRKSPVTVPSPSGRGLG